MKNKWVLISLGLLSFTLSSCGNNNPSVNVNDSIIGPTSVAVGDIVKYSYSSSKEYTWLSSDSLVLDISSNGEAVAFKSGIVTISTVDLNDVVLASLEVEVENKMSLPTSSLDISSLFEKAIELESEVVTSEIKITDTYIDQVRIQKANMYKNYYTVDISDSYKNYAGEFDESYVEYRGIKDGYYYDLSLKDESSYAIKRKIVDSNQTDYEILRSEAENRLISPRFIHTFYYDLAEMWGARTLDLRINGTETDDGFALELENTYLFLWANEIDNDSKHYKATLNFSNDGFLLNGEFELVTYEQTQYDVSTSSWKEDAKISSIYTITYSSSRGEKVVGEERINPTDYFVKEVTKATYEPINPLVVGGRINTDYIVLKEYESSSALDVKNILIVDVKNDEKNTVIVKDEVNGGYVAINEGTCYLICRMMYSSEVTFLVEVTVN